MLSFLKASFRASTTFSQKWAPLVESIAKGPGAWKNVAAELSTVPNVLANNNRTTARLVSALVKEGKLISVTSAHPNPKLAEVAKAFEDTMAHPIVKLFKRRNLQLVLDEHGECIPKTLLTPIFAADKKIILPKALIDGCSATEIVDILNHEIGHHLMQDANLARRIVAEPAVAFGLQVSQTPERIADYISVVLSKDRGKGLTRWLEKVAKQDAAAQRINEANQGGWFSRLTKKLKLYADFGPDDGHKAFSYPPTKERVAAIEQLSEQISTPNGRSHVERLLIERLDTNRRKLFPHHTYPAGRER